MLSSYINNYLIVIYKENKIVGRDFISLIHFHFHQYKQASVRGADARSRRSVLCFTIRTSKYTYSGEATTTPLASCYDTHTLTKPHSSLASHPATFAFFVTSIFLR